jgi:D-alanyl-D-alanine carboxypeptidase/D-alanyl-D-alanine-endopeptidase (penicillin-binding protein 4)
MKLLRLMPALMLAGCLSAASLAESIERLIASSPAARTAVWGIRIVDLASGKTLYEASPDHFFVPASNTKLFTTAMALMRLGPDFTFRTRVVADGPPDAEGRIHGEVRLVGGGDPNLSARAIPYRIGPTTGNATGNPLAAIADLADQVAAHGVKRIDGDVVGDDTWYVWEPYAVGWSIDDPRSDDGPPISALTLNDNTLTLNIRPGAAVGDPAVLTLNPPVEYYLLENRVRTVAAGGDRRVRMERIPGSRDVRLWGTLPLHDRGQEMPLGIEDPALYAAAALRQALEERGIAVAGSVRVRHLYPDQAMEPAPAEEPGIELASRTSAPLLEDLRITDKVSQNLHAELALRAVGRARRGIGSFEAALEEEKTFLAEAGIEPGAYNLLDGSGLSRLNLVTPAAVVKLLRYMYDSPARNNWISLLPVSGQDGTLATRLGDGAAAGHIHAKTGSLSHASALSGYAEKPGGQWVVFSILVNNYNGSAAEVRGVMDGICSLIME